MKTTIKTLSIIILLLLSFGALYGGWALISDPAGNKMGLSIELLKNTPFNNYFIPGLILLIINRLFPLLIIVALIRKSKNYCWYLIFQGCLLISWLTAEVILNKDFFIPSLHFPCYIIGILLVLNGYLLKIISVKSQKKQ